MPVIITAHIAHNSRRCGASHTGVIIHALAPVIAPYMSCDMTAIHAQQTSGTRISSATRGQERAGMWSGVIVDWLDCAIGWPHHVALDRRTDVDLAGQRGRADRLQLRLGLPVQLQRAAEQ